MGKASQGSKLPEAKLGFFSPDKAMSDPSGWKRFSIQHPAHSVGAPTSSSMSKRDRPADGDERPQKRQRHEPQAPPQIEEIHFARQLQDFLVFRQDGIQQLRNGIASFKAFLESILYHKEEDNRGRQISILREFLDTQKPLEGQEIDRPFLAQLWQAWSFASQNNSDHVSSSVSAILALLLKALSGILDLREYGTLLCRTVLQHQHLRLVKRSLDAPKHKDFVLSPALRLLTEVSTFDGGVMAREIYKRREQTFDVSALRRNLSLVKTDISEDEARRKPAIRTLTLRYILSLMKYLHEGGKIDILKNRPLCNSLFQYIRDDPPDIINEVLATIEQNILKDNELPRSSKAALLTSQALERVADIAAREPEAHASADKAFEWLTAVCTKPSYGILRQSGWYPPGTSKSEEVNDDMIDLGLDSLEFYDRTAAINVRNSTMLSWSLTLRAHANERERRLLLTCFKSAPELVAAYFGERTMQLDPKLTNTWIAYASLLFEVAELPVPDYLGFEDEWASVPPQTTIVIESILPRPLTQSVLVRCLNQSSELITYFVTRILITAAEKLGRIQKEMQSQTSLEKGELWKGAAARLLQRFRARCPPMKDIITVFRKLPDDDEHAMQREAVARLLRLLYEVTPLQALEEQVDISVALTAALMRSEATDTVAHQAVHAMRLIELEHLLTIAHQSLGMKWFNKQGLLRFSPLTTLLRIHRKEITNRQIRSLIQDVLVENGVLEGRDVGDKASPLDALVASLIHIEDRNEVWSFLDDCISRATKKPVKYVDDLEAIMQDAGSGDSRSYSSLPSLVIAVLLEQAPFVVSDHVWGRDKANWIELFFALLDHTSDSGVVLLQLGEAITKTNGWPGKGQEPNSKALLAKVKLDQGVQLAETVQGDVQDVPEIAPLTFSNTPIEPRSHPELLRWSQKDLDMAVEDGDVDALILCLCSEHIHVRKQANTELRKLQTSLRSNEAFENGSQICLLIGELLETFDQQQSKSESGLPYLAGTFAVRALHVQRHPEHFMYPKLNRFLIRGPEWRVSRLPAYWFSNSALGLPEEDDAYWREVQWVLDWLNDGLRSPADLEILRRGNMWEKVLALWSSPGSIRHVAIRERILEMVHRATCITGGSNMLITRAGILAWIDIVTTLENGVRKATLQNLRKQILDTCDKDRITTWAGKKDL